MGFLQSIIGFFGRALLSIIFLASGLHKILNWDATEQFLTHALNDCLSISVGELWIQEAIEWGLGNVHPLLIAAATCELLGGLMIFLGMNVRLGAFILFLFLLPTTLIFHHFWLLQGAERELQSVMFLKNISILGGLLILIAYGKGRCAAPRSEPSDHA